MFKYYTRSVKSIKVYKPVHIARRHNACDVIDDIHKVRQTEQLLRFLPVLGKRKNLKALVLDSSYRRTSKALLNESFHAKNIDLVEIKPNVAQEHRTTEHNVFEMQVCEHINNTDKQYDIMYLDTENSSSSALYLLHQTLENNILANKSILFLNFCSRGKHTLKCKELLNHGKKKQGLNMEDFWYHADRFLKDSSYKITKLYDGNYQRNPRGGNMRYFAIMLEKN